MNDPAFTYASAALQRLSLATRRYTRGKQAARLLEGFGIDPHRYWLLVDLFHDLSDRGEMLDQLGRNGVALQAAVWIYAAMTALMAIGMIAGGAAPATYLASFLAITAFLLFFILLSEAGNSLVNPTEGLILAHQPIDGATYTAAKLSHLARIVFSLVPAMNALPALGSLLLPHAPWYLPLLQLACALGVGLLAALLCCALYGWLIRLLPARRLKAAGQLAGAIPFVAMTFLGSLQRSVHKAHLVERLPAGPAAPWILAVAAGILAIAVVALGIRSLSADYLLRVSGILHGARRAPRARRRRWGESLAARFGGPPACAGWAFVSRMARRDYQFRRQALPMMAIVALSFVPLVARGWRTHPFSGQFTTMHFVPHLFGFVLFFLCSQLIYGDEYKGRWIFQLAPMRSMDRFAAGIYTALYVQIVAIPHLLLLGILAWAWGPWRAILFIAFSLAASSIYLALEIRLVDAIPFTRQTIASGNAALIGVMLLGALAIAAAVAVQYFVIFRSPAVAAAGTILLAAAAWLLTRWSLDSFAATIRFDLATVSGEAAALYREIEA